MKRLLCLLLPVLLLAGCAKDLPEEPAPTEPQWKTVYVHSSISYNSGGVSNRTDYCYDANNHLTDVIVSDAEGKQLHRYLVECDEHGNPIEWASAAGTTVNYTYDAQVRTLKTETYNGELFMTSTEYNWSGDLRISTTVKTPSQENRLEYTYDETGKLTRQDMYENGQLRNYGLYTLGEDGKPVLCSHYDAAGTLTATVTYEYLENQETRTTADAQGKVTMTNILTYDPQGNLLSEEHLDGSGATLSLEVHEWIPLEVAIDVPRASI